MQLKYRNILSLIYVAIFVSFCAFLLNDPKARFWIELDLAPLLPWITSHSAIALAVTFLLISGGSYSDRLILSEGVVKHPYLTGLMTLVILAIFCLLFAIYLTNSHYTIAHDRFAITAIIIGLATYFLWKWLQQHLQ